LKRIGVGVGVYLLVGFLTSFLGFNLLGAVFMSGPLVGRVVDANGHGIPGAFVSYEWRGQSYHGTTGCKAAAIVRSGPGGVYFIPWQGWRLVFATGWGISPAGPAVWAPGYIGKNGPNATTIYVPENDPAAHIGRDSTSSADKGSCFGWPYRSRLIELRTARFEVEYDRICRSRGDDLVVSDLGRLESAYTGVLLARVGDPLSEPGPVAEVRGQLETMLNPAAAPKPPYASDAKVTPELKSAFCALVKADNTTSGGQ
jgi:hypothetical protein